MRFRKIRFLATAAVTAGALIFTLLQLFGAAAPAAASGQAPGAARAVDRPSQAKPKDIPPIVIVTTDALASSVQIADISGDSLGNGGHFGQVKCNSASHCSRRTTVSFQAVEYEYKYSSLLSFDFLGRSVVVNGTGTVTNGRQKERFSFTATFQDNRDGTFWARYEASRPDASFVIPRVPGTFKIGRLASAPLTAR